jgi:hypothetical protein
VNRQQNLSLQAASLREMAVGIYHDQSRPAALREIARQVITEYGEIERKLRLRQTGLVRTWLEARGLQLLAPALKEAVMERNECERKG